MSCPCDQREFFHSWKIPAGLDSIPRQIATFPEFRSYMLSLIGTKNALTDWRARSENDLGIMLLEMWAYLCDSLTFYDEVIAHEEYLRTARQRNSLRKLTDLIGYLPKPAAAASASLAITAEGRKSITITDSTAFRSKAFGNESPQVFETTAEMIIHPLFSKWPMSRDRYSKLGAILAGESALLVKNGTLNAEEGDILFLNNTKTFSKSGAAIVETISDYAGEDKEKYTKLIFSSNFPFTHNTQIKNSRIFKPTQFAALWSGDNDDAVSSNKKTILLDGLYKQIRNGQSVLVEKNGSYRWFQVKSAKQVNATVQAAQTLTYEDGSSNPPTVEIPAVTAPVTEITLDKSLNNSDRKSSGDSSSWSNSDRDDLLVHFGMTDAGKVTQELKKYLSPENSLKLATRLEEPEDVTLPSQFFLSDYEENAVKIPGQLDFDSDSIDLSQNHDWEKSLRTPVFAYGNVIDVSRGEMVKGEVLGNGDASITNQSFELKKKPLTYVPSSSVDNEWNLKSTLEVYVNGIRWDEVRSFYGTEPDDQVYIVRHDEDGKTTVIIGDGINGARVPSGEKNVVANYRHGAGESAPPVRTITQIVKPVIGVKTVTNFLAAYGGSDAEAAENIRSNAPDSALLFSPKRAVSIADFKTVATEVTGVKSASACWVWDQQKQRPVVKLWYMGDAQLLEKVKDALINAADPTTPIQVEVADSREVSLSIEIIVNSRYIPSDVESSVSQALVGTNGALLPENLGIGTPIFRSEIAALVLAIDGVLGIQSILWEQNEMTEFGKSPGEGLYIDFVNNLSISSIAEDTDA